MDINKIPTDELMQDLKDGEEDIDLCRKALANGVTVYSGGTVAHRMATNEIINSKIRAELTRRRLEATK